MDLKKKDLVAMYKKMLEIRYFEEATIELYKEGTMPGLAHPYIGEEAIAVGVCYSLKQDDYVVSTHRGHGHLIAKGGDLKHMMSEILGRKTGYCQGRGGSMHIADFSLGILGANGIVGGGLPIAVGAGLTAKRREKGQVSVVFFGDAASNQGTFHESLNLASTWRLPVIFVNENNGFGISVSQEKHQNIKDISQRALGYGIPGVTADGNDVIAVYDTFAQALERARSNEGPSLLEFKTTRWTGHHVGDPGNGSLYRKKEELEESRNNCAITKLEDKLLKDKTITDEETVEIKRSIRQRVDDAVMFAKDSPMPDVSEIYEYLFA